jgi:hypothetical protein
MMLLNKNYSHQVGYITLDSSWHASLSTESTPERSMSHKSVNLNFPATIGNGSRLPLDGYMHDWLDNKFPLWEIAAD